MAAEDQHQAVVDSLNMTISGLHSAAALLIQQNVDLKKRVGDLEAENAVLRAAAKERD
jgi:cell division protein FtsB